MSELLSLKQLATTLNLSTYAVRNMVARGDIEARRVGGRWYVSRACLEAWLNPHPQTVKPRRVHVEPRVCRARPRSKRQGS